MPGRPSRSPQYVRFIGSGALLGALVAFVVARLAPRTTQFSWTDVLLYLGLIAVLVGGLLGGLLAVLLDGRGTTAGAPSAGRPRGTRTEGAADRHR